MIGCRMRFGRLGSNRLQSVWVGLGFDPGLNYIFELSGFIFFLEKGLKVSGW